MGFCNISKCRNLMDLEYLSFPVKIFAICVNELKHCVLMELQTCSVFSFSESSQNICTYSSDYIFYLISKKFEMFY